MMKKYILPLLCLSAMNFVACSSDDKSGDSNPVNPPMSSYVDPNAGTIITPASSASPISATIPTPNATYAPIAPTADMNATNLLFVNWKSYHFTTLEYEHNDLYPSQSDEMDEIFSVGYQPAGRVIWSSQSGGYKSPCGVTDAKVSAMKYRACSVSEGIGYGMLIAAFQNDTDMFNRLWNYNRAFRAYNNGNTNLMPWLVKSFTYQIVDESSATDADLDVATALILMYYKSQQQVYLNDALLIINDLWNEEVEQSTFRLLSGNTSMWNGKSGKEIVYNLSYFSPVALRLFAMVDPNHNWNAVLDAMYSYMATVQAGGTGVFPDWSNGAGVAVNPPNKSAGESEKNYTWYTFNKESVRIPWRIAWDYYWYQDPRAFAVLKTLNDFIVAKSGNNPNSDVLSANYTWNAAYGSDKTNSVVGPHWYAAWCATGIGTNDLWLQTCTSGLNQKAVLNNGSSYFSDILLMMYSQLLNGFYVKPF